MEWRRWALPAAYALSAGLHLGLYVLLPRAGMAGLRSETIAVEINETVKPPPPPMERTEPARPAEPARKIAPAPPQEVPPREAKDEPPPPNSPPPPDAPPPEQAPPRIGISMSSTTTGGSFAAPVGNTLYGKPPEKAEDPATVKPYRAENYAPPAEVTTLPQPIDVTVSKEEYPEEARKLGIEGEVKLRLFIDASGRVREARILQDPGHGFGEAAVRSALRFRFRPARRGDNPVATEIPFTIRYELT